MMMLWAWAGVPLGIYNIVMDYNIALQIQPQALTFLSLVTWIQCYYYEKVPHSRFWLGRRMNAKFLRAGRSGVHSLLLSQLPA
jgi:hypothetical protein